METAIAFPPPQTTPVQKPRFTKARIADFLRLIEQEESAQKESLVAAMNKIAHTAESEKMERENRSIEEEGARELERAKNMLDKLGRAKTRINNGTFGLCMHNPCRGNGVIEEGRLESTPYAEWCIEDAGCGPRRR